MLGVDAEGLTEAVNLNPSSPNFRRDEQLLRTSPDGHQGAVLLASDIEGERASANLTGPSGAMGGSPAKNGNFGDARNHSHPQFTEAEAASVRRRRKYDLEQQDEQKTSKHSREAKHDRKKKKLFKMFEAFVRA